MFYAGIGSRSTPVDVLTQMAQLALELASKGWILRSGGASGADTAFESGAADAQHARHIYRADPNPLRKFSTAPDGLTLFLGATDWAYECASALHPAWDRCSPIARNLHARNVHQICGPTTGSIKSAFVACWTPDGAETADECNIRTGGTGMAIRIASRLRIPVLNFQRGDVRSRLIKLFEA